jgi:hypothetical protein
VTASGRAAAAGCDSENESTTAAVAAIAPMARVCRPLIVNLLNLPRDRDRDATCMDHRSKEQTRSEVDAPLRGCHLIHQS